MEWVKRKIRFLKRRNEKLSPWYIENGGKVLEGLIAFSNGRYDIPYRVFTVEELNKATNVDFPSLRDSDSRSVMWDVWGYYISGIFQQRSILVKKFRSSGLGDAMPSLAVNDIVFTVLMNRHKNVLKVLGCCLDLETPAIIYEIGLNHGLLRDLLFNGNNTDRSLCWSNRLKIATDVANAVVYLHTAFPTPIIHRDLTTRNIVIDNNGVAKLFDFSLCVALPPGESQMEVGLAGTQGPIEPDYMQTNIITEKTDVYGFGIILLQLLTGRHLRNLDDEHPCLEDFVEHHVEKNEYSKILDPKILGEIGEIEHQLQAFTRLTLRCTVVRGADRPYIIDVAKELVRIQRSVHPTQRSSR
ncbi:non-functional pseudokinase ZED1-like [Olea europaea var. sylvestris]|uniref:non-functional pseudokinase ZED1-like n=1 Tax=Olea europaea var. sylvestris TaxID=158386 RepID=UPI000C1D88BF|nr:non-functional pseudokinase ZED1-like [Olea europaea var. sylvestris]XP_022843710.1 non-functional pseudokinase ZED1-like [Olea europaea var. sylvestris]